MSISDHILVSYSNPMGETCFQSYFSVTECWTGFIGDTENFCLFVIDKEIIKAEALITELSGSSRHVEIRAVAHLVGLMRPKFWTVLTGECQSRASQDTH